MYPSEGDYIFVMEGEAKILRLMPELFEKYTTKIT